VTSDEIEIRSFEEKDAEAFRTLNEEWITKYFSLEEADRLVLNDPLEHIIRQGGNIFMAFRGLEPVGCCALIKMETGGFELAKMAVAESSRRQGIGRKLLAYTINQARILGAKSLFLGSNTKLADAIHLYEDFGFRHLEPHEAPSSPYSRANVFMDMKLT
jgi:GNAT superfamily N-acetyltransferase